MATNLKKQIIRGPLKEYVRTVYAISQAGNVEVGKVIIDKRGCFVNRRRGKNAWTVHSIEALPGEAGRPGIAVGDRFQVGYWLVEVVEDLGHGDWGVKILSDSRFPEYEANTVTMPEDMLRWKQVRDKN